ncbi:c-type cytochrome [uncultured Shimia sp.]|uniref:c-type cytochrome n=1 Tax=uncultured Shimia sp. TaxID=573152 RepID=UPI0025F11D75|nr:c-type cytochrome [uncultured Shimia sp.]
MKFVVAAATAALLVASPATAEGDVEAGEKAFKRCKACHSVVNPDGDVLYKGGKTGPNLYGIVGRTIGSEDFKYGAGLLEANEAGVTWTEESLAAYVVDPKAWLGDNGYATKSKMSFKLKKGGDDVFAYLASLAPAAETEEKSE